MFLLDVAHELALRILLSLQRRLSFTHLGVEITRLAADFLIHLVSLVKHLTLFFAHISLTFSLLIKLQEVHFLRCQVILDLDDSIVVIGAFKLKPHPIDLLLQHELFAFTLPDFLVFQCA